MGITLLYKLASRATGDRAPAVITQPITDLAAAGSGDIVVDGGWLSFVFSGPADARRVDTNTTLGVLTALTRLSYDDYDTALRGWFESLAAKGVKRVIITLDGPFTVQKSEEHSMRKRRRYADALNIAWRAVTRGDITWLEQRAGWGNGQVPASILLQLVRTVADANAAIAAAAGSAASVGAAAGSRGTSGDRIGLVFAEGEADLLAVHMYRRLRASALVSNDSDYLLCQVPRGLGEAPPAGAAAAGGAAAGGLAAAATAASAAATAATAATAAPSSDLVVVRSFDTRVGGELLRRDATAFTNVFNVAATQAAMIANIRDKALTNIGARSCTCGASIPASAASPHDARSTYRGGGGGGPGSPYTSSRGGGSAAAGSPATGSPAVVRSAYGSTAWSPAPVASSAPGSPSCPGCSLKARAAAVVVDPSTLVEAAVVAGNDWMEHYFDRSTYDAAFLARIDLTLTDMIDWSESRNVCRSFARGRCTFGDRCKYKHEIVFGGAMIVFPWVVREALLWAVSNGQSNTAAWRLDDLQLMRDVRAAMSAAELASFGASVRFHRAFYSGNADFFGTLKAVAAAPGVDAPLRSPSSVDSSVAATASASATVSAASASAAAAAAGATAVSAAAVIGSTPFETSAQEQSEAALVARLTAAAAADGDAAPATTAIAQAAALQARLSSLLARGLAPSIYELMHRQKQRTTCGLEWCPTTKRLLQTLGKDFDHTRGTFAPATAAAAASLPPAAVAPLLPLTVTPAACRFATLSRDIVCAPLLAAVVPLLRVQTLSVVSFAVDGLTTIDHKANSYRGGVYNSSDAQELDARHVVLVNTELPVACARITSTTAASAASSSATDDVAAAMASLSLGTSSAAAAAASGGNTVDAASLASAKLSASQRWLAFVALVRSALSSAEAELPLLHVDAATGAASCSDVAAAFARSDHGLQTIPAFAAIAAAAAAPAVATTAAAVTTASALDSGLLTMCMAAQYLQEHLRLHPQQWAEVGLHAVDADQLSYTPTFPNTFANDVLPALLTQAVLLHGGVHVEAALAIRFDGASGARSSSVGTSAAATFPAATRMHWMHAISLGHWVDGVCDLIGSIAVLTSDADGVHPAAALPSPKHIYHQPLFMFLLDACGYFADAMLPAAGSIAPAMLTITTHLATRGLVASTAPALLRAILVQFGVPL